MAVGGGVMAVGEGVMGLPVQVTAGVMHMNEEKPPSPEKAAALSFERAGRSFRRSTAPDDGSLFGFVGPEAAAAAAAAAEAAEEAAAVAEMRGGHADAARRAVEK